MVFNLKEHERNLEILSLRNTDKKTFQEIGAKFNLSHSRVVQICKTGPSLQEYIKYVEAHPWKRYPKELKRIRNIYACLRQRITNPLNKDYKHYGGRGITMSWKSFDEFYADMKEGYLDGLTIDRMNTNGNYCKENCRWVTQKEQPKNRRPASEWEKTSTYWLKNRNS